MLLKTNYVNYLIVILAIPMILYLFNIIPYLDDTSKIWSSIGLWISSCVICSYIYIYQNINSYGIDNKNFLMNSPISFLSLICSNVIICIFMVFVQLLVSYTLTLLLNNISLSLIDFVLLFLNVLPIALLVISIALLISVFDRLNLGLFVCTILAMSIIQFFYLFPSFEKISYKYIPIIGVFVNCASLFNNGYVEIWPLVLMYLISFSILAISLFFIAKVMESRNER